MPVRECPRCGGRHLKETMEKTTFPYGSEKLYHVRPVFSVTVPVSTCQGCGSMWEDSRGADIRDLAVKSFIMGNHKLPEVS